MNPEVHRSQAWRGECLLGNGNRREQVQKIKEFDVQSWAVQLKSQRDLRQGEGAKQIIPRLPLIMRAEKI